MSLNSSGTGSTSFNFVVGPIKGEQVIVNPTLSELQEYGVNWFTKEPEYVGKDREDNTQYIVDIWFKIEPFSYNGKTIESGSEVRNMRFYLGTKDKVAQSGSKQFTNKFGRFVYADSLESASSYPWFSQEGIRPALEGEEAICRFIENFGNFKKGDELLLNKEALLKRDLSEIKEFVKSKPTHKFKCLLGLSYNAEKDRYISEVYTKELWRSWANELSVKEDGSWNKYSFEEGIPKLLSQEYNEFKKSILHPGIPMILDIGEVKKMSETPDTIGGDAPQVEDDVF